MTRIPALEDIQPSAIPAKLKGALAIVGLKILQARSRREPAPVVLTDAERTNLGLILDCGPIMQSVTFPALNGAARVATIIGRFESACLPEDVFNAMVKRGLITNGAQITDAARAALADEGITA